MKIRIETKRLGNDVLSKMIKEGLTTEDVAELMGLQKDNINKLIDGEKPTPFVIVRTAKWLGKRFEDFVK